MKAWLKGGLIGLVIWIILFIALYADMQIASSTCDALKKGDICASSFGDIILGIFFIASFPFFFIRVPMAGSYALTALLSFIILGIIIGLIVGKLRRKK